MKNKLIIILLLLFSCSTNKVDFEQPNFNFIKVNIIGILEIENKINSQLIITIPNNKMVFYKDRTGFKSDLSFNVIVNDINGNIILNDSWDEEVMENYFEDTKSNNKLVINKNLLLSEGDYTLNLFINDYNNHLSWYKKNDFKVDREFNFPEITIYQKKNNQFKYIMNDQILDLDTIWINSLRNDDFANFKINYKYYTTTLDTSKLVFENVINNYMYKEYFPIEIIDDFFNTLEINMILNDKHKKKIINFNRVINIDFDYSLLVGPMGYIFENSEFSLYRKYNALNDSSKIEYIVNYWELDSNEHNNLFEEFYNRVIYTNKNFGYSFTSGWDSDRGKIYIIYGKPIDVKNQFDIDGDYEIWVYKNNLQFVFINRYGIYELYNPNY
jgi:GWxTD domain-containing protein